MSRAGLLMLVMLGAGCQGGGTTGMTPPPPQPPGPPGATANVAMTSSDDGYGNAEFRFQPASVTVTRSGTVTWSNNTGVAHNVTFTAAQGAPADVPDGTSGASRNFATAGTFIYRCTNHQGMQGQVTVQ